MFITLCLYDLLTRIFKLMLFTDNKKNKNVYLTVLSKEDGKEDIVKAAKKFCSSVCSNECKPKSMDVEQFSGLLEGKNFPPK